jgi:hydroxyacylglutathione hydrolase
MLHVQPLPALDDNYIWLLRPQGGRRVAVVDPGDEEPVFDALRRDGLSLGAILITHHHDDHVGGVADLVAACPGVQVIGPRDRRIQHLTRVVGEGDLVEIPGLTEPLRVMEVPGHTASHIAYVGAGALFCGDTLFSGGCGRVFDGTFAQLSASLRRIADLPPETLVYCAHEYTLANLGFARLVEATSLVLARRELDARADRAAGRPTVPSTLALELATNPFLRTGEAEVIAAAARSFGRPLNGHAAVFTALRRWKDERYD